MVKGLNKQTTYSAEASKAILTDIGFYGVDALDNDVEPDVKLLVVDQQRVFDVPLHKEFVRLRAPR